ncbi:MAG: TerB family tellurite resistance protein [Pseudomonadales bacterium]|nr:TerB family tellurite resistance protein [Pseudomonadales bacterium]
MINKLKSFFNDCISTEGFNAVGKPDQPLEKRLQLATAALLLEMVNADFEVLEVEQASLITSLKTGYNLSDEEIKELLALSEQETQASNSVYPFTRLINDHYNETQKREVIRLMWKVALADGHIDKHEMHLMRKISDLLYVPRPVVMEIKQQELKGAS